MASVLELSQLSNAVYQAKNGVISAPVAGWVAVNKHGDPGSGFYGVLFQRSRDQESVLAIRGTDPTQLGDLKSDMQLAAGLVPSQFYDADAFLTQLQPQMGGRALYVTGHSLGGGLASLLSAKYHLPTVTFNAPGMKNSMCSVLRNAKPAAPSASAAQKKAEDELNALDVAKMLNLRAAGDVVSRGTGPAIGRVEDINVPEGMPSAWVVGVASMFQLGGVVTAGSYALGQHSMDNVCKAVALVPKYKTELNWLATVPVLPTVVRPKIVSAVHTVVSGDSLAKIAQAYYKDPARWKDIYAVPANRAAIGTNPAMIRPGLRLSIPA